MTRMDVRSLIFFVSSYWSVFFAGYFAGKQEFNSWVFITAVLCGVLCIVALVNRHRYLLGELHQLRIWNGEDLQRHQEAAKRRQVDDEVTDPGSQS